MTFLGGPAGKAVKEGEIPSIRGTKLGRTWPLCAFTTEPFVREVVNLEGSRGKGVCRGGATGNSRECF